MYHTCRCTINSTAVPLFVYSLVGGGTHDTYVPPVDAHVQLLSAVARWSDSYCIFFVYIHVFFFYFLCFCRSFVLRYIGVAGVGVSPGQRNGIDLRIVSGVYLSLSFFCQRIWVESICMPYLLYPVRRHVIPLSTLLTTLLWSILCVVVLWPQSLYISRRKNRHGHWVCWTSTGRKNGFMWRTHTLRTAVFNVLPLSFCDRIAYIPLGRRISEDTGCAAFRRVEGTVWCE